MTHYNALNVKLSNSQVSKLRSGVKDGTEITTSSENFHQMLLVILMMRLIFRISYY